MNEKNPRAAVAKRGIAILVELVGSLDMQLEATSNALAEAREKQANDKTHADALNALQSMIESKQKALNEAEQKIAELSTQLEGETNHARVIGETIANEVLPFVKDLQAKHRLRQIIIADLGFEVPG